ncbi:MAG: radical SAM protein [Bacteroidales bacterium]|nr:radical SAM protein [Bacteroidales bacterium]MBN2749088.1 radical SAM protein [Bacteroidales bacterium]
MYFFPIQYDEPLFRPPSEANAAIVQATLGCSWNSCAFCNMYETKKFKVRPFDDVRHDIAALAKAMPTARKVFLADGNAFVLSYDKLMPIVSAIKEHFGKVHRISAYALPGNILAKTHEQLCELRANGLTLLYIGVESGDNDLLAMINKSETAESTLEGISKAHAAGIDTSVMIINGLGGQKYSQQHALNSANLVSQLNPKFLSTLTLFTPHGLNQFQTQFKGDFIPQTQVEQLNELRLFIEHLELDGTIFRSNHVSNSVGLEGVLPKDKATILTTLNQVIAQVNNWPQSNGIRNLGRY